MNYSEMKLLLANAQGLGMETLSDLLMYAKNKSIKNKKELARHLQTIVDVLWEALK